MKLNIDFEAKTISIENTVNIAELMERLAQLKFDLSEWTLQNTKEIVYNTPTLPYTLPYTVPHTDPFTQLYPIYVETPNNYGIDPNMFNCECDMCSGLNDDIEDDIMDYFSTNN